MLGLKPHYTLRAKNAVQVEPISHGPHSFALDVPSSNRPFSLSDLPPLHKQVKSIMREYTGVCVSDLKLLFNSSQPPLPISTSTTTSKSKTSTSSSLARAVHDAKKSSVKLFPSSSKYSSKTTKQPQDPSLLVEELQQRLAQASRDVDRYKTTCDQQTNRIRELEGDVCSLKSIDTSSTLCTTVHRRQQLEELLQQLDDLNDELDACRDQWATEKEDLQDGFAQREKILTLQIRQLAAERVQSLAKEKRYLAEKQAQLQQQERKEVVQNNSHDDDVEVVLLPKEEDHQQQQQQQVEEWRREKRELQGKVQSQEEVITTARAAVAELEESLATKQLQIESLTMVNREQRQQLVLLQSQQGNSPGVESSEAESHSGMAGSCSNSLASLQEQEEEAAINSTTGTEDVASPTPIEVLESQWEEQRAQVASIQQAQEELFQQVGKKNSDATTKLDKLCNSMGIETTCTTGEKLLTTDPANEEEEEATTNAPNEDNDNSTVIEQFEQAWMQQTEEIKSLQRDQDVLIARMRASSSDNNNDNNNEKAAPSGDSTSTATSDDKDEIDSSEIAMELSKANDTIRSLQAENKRLAQKLLDAETAKLEMELEKHSSETDDLDEIIVLKEEKVALVQAAEDLKDELERMEQEKTATLRDLETRALVLDKAEAIAAQQRETIDCLRGDRRTLELAMEDHRSRTRELEAVCSFQKNTIGSMHAEKNSLIKRLLDTEGDFRKHLNNNLNMQAQISELKSTIGNTAAGGTVSPIKEAVQRMTTDKNVNIREVSFDTTAETTIATSFEEEVSVDNNDNEHEDWDAGETVESDASNDCETVESDGSNDSKSTSPSELPEDRPTESATTEVAAAPTSKESEVKKMEAVDVLRLMSFF